MSEIPKIRAGIAVTQPLIRAPAVSMTTLAASSAPSNMALSSSPAKTVSHRYSIVTRSRNKSFVRSFSPHSCRHLRQQRILSTRSNEVSTRSFAPSVRLTRLPSAALRGSPKASCKVNGISSRLCVRSVPVVDQVCACNAFVPYISDQVCMCSASAADISRDSETSTVPTAVSTAMSNTACGEVCVSVDSSYSVSVHSTTRSIKVIKSRNRMWNGRRMPLRDPSKLRSSVSVPATPQRLPSASRRSRKQTPVTLSTSVPYSLTSSSPPVSSTVNLSTSSLSLAQSQNTCGMGVVSRSDRHFLDGILSGKPHSSSSTAKPDQALSLPAHSSATAGSFAPGSTRGEGKVSGKCVRTGNQPSSVPSSVPYNTPESIQILGQQVAAANVSGIVESRAVQSLYNGCVACPTFVLSSCQNQPLLEKLAMQLSPQTLKPESTRPRLSETSNSSHSSTVQPSSILCTIGGATASTVLVAPSSDIYCRSNTGKWQHQKDIPALSTVKATPSRNVATSHVADHLMRNGFIYRRGNGQLSSLRAVSGKSASANVKPVHCCCNSQSGRCGNGNVFDATSTTDANKAAEPVIVVSQHQQAKRERPDPNEVAAVEAKQSNDTPVPICMDNDELLSGHCHGNREVTSPAELVMTVQRKTKRVKLCAEVTTVSSSCFLPLVYLFLNSCT